MKPIWLNRQREALIGGAVLVILLSGFTGSLAAQGARGAPGEAPDSGATRWARTTAGPQYGAGWPHRILFGADYRRLWTTPIQVQVLDLTTYAGGLRPVSVGGGKQTQSMYLATADGRTFAFRSVDKDPSRILRPDLRNTLVGWVVKDQVSAGHPAGALVVPPLLDAAGIRHPTPQLFVMPDDPSLGRFRREFAGMLGQLEAVPNEETAGQTGSLDENKAVRTDRLFAQIDRGEDIRVDARGFLAARLMDDFMGDWDRQATQWYWIKTAKGNEAAWEPIPYDRDQAFSRYGGVLAGAARHERPVVPITNFGDKYTHIFDLNWNGRALDRRLLAELDWAVWDSVARGLQARLTDSVIGSAVARLPQAYYREDGARLVRALKHRRDRLPAMAREFYSNLAEAAEVHTTDASETITAVRGGSGTLDLTIRRRGVDSGQVERFHRRFLPGETEEVRLVLRGGEDSVRVVGPAGGPPIRVIGGTGSKVVRDDAAGGRTRVYPDSATVAVGGANRPSVDRRSYDSTGMAVAPRDFGRWWTVRTRVGGQSDAGFIFGSKVSLTNYGFRRNPYAFRLDLLGAYATGAGGYLFEVRADRWLENSGTHFVVEARASGVDVLRYYGLGNNTADPGSSDFYRAYEHQYSVSPSVGFSAGPRTTISIGPVLKRWSTNFDKATLLTQTRPYGSGDFGQFGGQMALSFDTRDTVLAPRQGMHLNVGGTVYPAVWDVASTFGEAHGEASTYLPSSLPLQPTLGLRAGGKHVWGDYPFQEGAYVGGRSTVRGLKNDRYLGDAAAYGNAELRLHLYDFGLPVPGKLGVFGLADAGRVWVEGESPDGWHHSVGGGVWVDWLNPRNTMSFAVTRAEGETGFYVASGLRF